MRTVTGAEEAVGELLEPRSIAIIGASTSPEALSWWPLHLLQHNRFAGELYPVNPKYDSIAGLRCYASILDVGRPVDVALHWQQWNLRSPLLDAIADEIVSEGRRVLRPA